MPELDRRSADEVFERGLRGADNRVAPMAREMCVCGKPLARHFTKHTFCSGTGREAIMGHDFCDASAESHRRFVPVGAG